MYLLDEETLQQLKSVEKFLYQDSALSQGFIDRKRDMANLLNYAISHIERDKVTE